ncbi:MAG: phage tail sheath protein FI [Paracoccaceae bacterium]
MRRTADFINEVIEKAYLEFVDKPFWAANVKLMLETGNAAMRTFIAERAIIGGKVWLDLSLNEPTQLAAGRITFSLDFEPPAPMKDIRFIAHRNIQYYLELTKLAIQAAA